MALAVLLGSGALLADDGVPRRARVIEPEQPPEERQRKLTKAEKKRAERQARNLRLATHHQEPKDGDDD
jgi:hypothetical protein